MSGPRAVFLDLDGCLVDSTVAIGNSIAHALASVGVAPLAGDELRRAIGPPLVVTFRAVLSAAGLDEGLAAPLVERYRERYRAMAVAETRVVPGVPEALAALGAMGPTAVVTSKPGAMAGLLLEGLGLRDAFAAVHGPDDDAITEPKAVTLGRALDAFGVAASSTVMVGDREHDVVAGRAHGTATVGVLWGAGDRAELEAAGADRVVTAPAELAGAVTEVTRTRPASG